MIRQYDRLEKAYKKVIEELGEFVDGYVSEIIYNRNKQEYPDSPTGDYAYVRIKYPTPTGLMKRGILEYDSKNLFLPHRNARIVFHPNRTVVITNSTIHDHRRHLKNFSKATVKTIMDETAEYDGYMHSEVIKKLIKREGLQTFLKIGDENEWEDRNYVF